MSAQGAGKAAVQARTAWTLEMRMCKLRCLENEDGSGYKVQIKTHGPWNYTSHKDASANELLRRLVRLITSGVSL